MALGYDGKLYILAFDHRGSFQKKMFGIEGEPTPRRPRRSTPSRSSRACSMRSGAAPGGRHRRPRRRAVRLRHPRARPGRRAEAGDAGREVRPERVRLRARRRLRRPHREVRPDFSKVLVRYNPDDDAEMNEPARRLKRLADWLHETDRKFLFELLVPATEGQLAPSTATPTATTPTRPELMRQRSRPSRSRHRGRHLEDRGRRRALRRRDAGRAGPLRRGSRRRRRVLLGRGLDREGRALAPAGRAGRRLHRLRDRPLDLVGRAQGASSTERSREAAASQIADNYLHFVRVYEGQVVH